jgi:hypothetical protein
MRPLILTKIDRFVGFDLDDLILPLEMIRRDAISLLLSAAAKFADLVDEKVERSRPDNEIQSSRSPRSAPIDEG